MSLSTWGMVLFLVLIGLGGAAVVSYDAYASWRLVRLRDHGIAITGKMVRLKTIPSKENSDNRSPDSHGLKYRYEVAGIVHERETWSVDADVFESIRWGSPVRVWYDPSDPQCSVSEYESGAGALEISGIILMFSLAIFVIVSAAGGWLNDSADGGSAA